MPLAHLLAARFNYDVQQGGFSQLLFNMRGECLAEIEDMLITANAAEAHEYYVQAIQICLANRAEYQRFLNSNYLDKNDVKHQLQILSIEYLSKRMPFASEASEYLISIWRQSATPPHP